jgi:hypothetical protein
MTTSNYILQIAVPSWRELGQVFDSIAYDCRLHCTLAHVKFMLHIYKLHGLKMKKKSNQLTNILHSCLHRFVTYLTLS